MGMFAEVVVMVLGVGCAQDVGRHRMLCLIIQRIFFKMNFHTTLTNEVRHKRRIDRKSIHTTARPFIHMSIHPSNQPSIRLCLHI